VMNAISMRSELGKQANDGSHLILTAVKIRVQSLYNKICIIATHFVNYIKFD